MDNSFPLPFHQNTPKISAAVLKNLSSINKAIPISLKEMRELMHECKDLEPPDGANNKTIGDSPNPQKIDPWSIITGIVPGTKWCGNGDIASTYFDLGYFTEVDKCCRAHDICPVKVRGFETRYNIKNVSFYTKSHCDCDTTFYQCLKATQHPAANLMGRFYFNLLRTQCIEDIQSSTSNEPKRIFRPPKHIY
ncbi:Phospholipase A2 [Gryllus bimaculatus]|nr:Phospholipase A2 [Gryllus bimaculatus]